MIKPKFNSQSKKIQSSVQIDKAGQIIQHFSTKHADNSPKHEKHLWYEIPLVVTVAIAFLALLLTIILCVIEKKTGIKGQVTLAGINPSLLYIVLMVVLAITYRAGIRIIIFVLIPLLGTTASLVSASYLLDKPVFEIIEIIIKHCDDDFLPNSQPPHSEITPVTPPAVVPEHSNESDRKKDEQETTAERDMSDPLKPLSDTVASRTPETEKPKRPSAVVTATVSAVKEPDFTNSIGMKFVLIPAGDFIMGSPENEKGRYDGETQHKVTLTKNFYMQTTEVTQGEWQAVMGNNPSYFKECGDDCPVERVSWDDAQEFLDRLNLMGEGRYRLPTEAEWEYAARAGSISAFANGDITETECGYDPNLDAMGWYCGNSDNKTHPVAQKQSNAWGLFDMHGNVREWCAVENFSDRKKDSLQIIRGGSYLSGASSCRSANHISISSDSRSSVLGFRVLREAP